VEENKFSIVFSHSAQREIEELEIQDALQLARDIKTHLERSPFPFGKTRIKKLTGFHPPLYRLRSGDYRVYYRIISREVAILAITHKKDSEKHLRRLRLGKGTKGA
jgi:mRNA-degrading endonuclease RelE of RelBE toxin-antitoxin system